MSGAGVVLPRIAGDRPDENKEPAMASVGLHEEKDSLNPKTIDLHRAIVSLMEELEAVDWYQQRADACTDAQLKAVLEHNRDEEMEHAAMVLEWIRRTTPSMDKFLRTYLFTEGDITKIEKAATGGKPRG
jgi:ferritin-like protein